MLKVTVLVFALIINATFALNEDLYKLLWSKYKVNHRKVYLSPEHENIRYGIFKRNVDKIEKHNSQYSMGLHTYYMSINQFSDWTFEEFKEKMLMREENNQTSFKSTHKHEKIKFPMDIKVADSYDWREQGVVTPVKSQGQCGSCWTFSATGAIESAYAIATGNLVTLSEQQIMDCSSDDPCKGGDKRSAFQYVKDCGGIETEDEYPYEAQKDTCRFNSGDAAVQLSGYTNLPAGDEGALRDTIASIGPVAVSVYVTDNFMNYGGGVFTDDTCPNDSTNHAVLAVGYGSDEQDYWIIKNSWSDRWGEEGYIRFARNRNSMCAVALRAAFPSIA